MFLIIFIEFIGIAYFACLRGNVTSICSNFQHKKNLETVKQDELQLWLMLLDKAHPYKRLPGALQLIQENYPSK